VQQFHHVGQRPRRLARPIPRKKALPLGTSIFIGLRVRAADTALQYTLLSRTWGTTIIESLNGTIAPRSNVIPFLTPYNSSSHALAFTGLGPYPALIVALAAGSSTKHIAWALGIKEQEMTPGAAAIIGVFNTVFNTANTLLSLWSVTSAAPNMAMGEMSTLTEVIISSPSVMLGLGL
jgi:hypothetical protein